MYCKILHLDRPSILVTLHFTQHNLFSTRYQQYKYRHPFALRTVKCEVWGFLRSSTTRVDMEIFSITKSFNYNNFIVLEYIWLSVGSNPSYCQVILRQSMLSGKITLLSDRLEWINIVACTVKKKYCELLSPYITVLFLYLSVREERGYQSPEYSPITSLTKYSKERSIGVMMIGTGCQDTFLCEVKTAIF